MRVSSLARINTKPTRNLAKKAKSKKTSGNTSGDRVTFTGKLGKITKGAVIGAAIGAAAAGIGFAGAALGFGSALLGIAGAGALGIGLAHKMDMVVPSTFSAPERAGREKTFYGATAGIIGGAFGATMMGIGLLSGGGVVAAGALGIGYAAALAGTRNTIMGIGEQFENVL